MSTILIFLENETIATKYFYITIKFKDSYLILIISAGNELSDL